MNTKMTDGDLQLLIEGISIKVFKKQFRHAASFNKRLRTTGGRYMLNDHSIQINPLVLEKHGMEELVGVIKHELCHYHLHLENKGYKHRDRDFKDLLRKTNSPRYCRPLAEQNRKINISHKYKCQSCGLVYQRKRRMDVMKYRCGKCTGEIKEL